MEETLDLEGAARLLKTHKSTIRTKAASGEIPGAKIGRCWVFIEADLMKYLRSRYPGKVELPCLSTNKKIQKSGGLISPTLGIGYADQLAVLIDQRRKKSITRSK
jgi:excisionase family DNA binding protein